MDFWNRPFVRRHLFVALLVFAWLMAVGFILVQYGRERSLRAEMIDERLQTINSVLLHTYPDLTPASETGIRGLRVTVIDRRGRVLHDNAVSAATAPNHRSRPEVRQAIESGRGRCIDRQSATAATEYFYSATASDSLIVRTAMPYDVSLHAMLRADGAFFWMMTLITLLLGSMALYQHRHALHEEREKDRIKRQLTNNINHELKTPVASILVCVETLRDHGAAMSAERRDEFLGRCYAEADRLRRLLADVSAITRMDEAPAMIAAQRVDLSALVREAVDSAMLRPEAQRFHFDTTIDDSIFVRGNASLLHSVFTNLIDNAIAYSEGNEITLRLSADSATACTAVVADNGIGVAAEHLPRLFERFYRVDQGRSRAAGGTGLGLSIVKNAVRLHRGTIDVQNRPSGGLVFTIRLPRE